MDRKTARKAIRKHRRAMLKKANVNIIGYGYKIKDGQKTDELVIVFGVTKKLSMQTLAKKDQIPPTLEGIGTDVIETNNIVAQNKKKKKRAALAAAATEFDPTQKHRPAMPGISIGHKNITAGTFGCVVKKEGLSYILSNNHVLANSNDAEIGDEIYQPGVYDGGSSADLIAHLAEFVPIVFGGEGTPPGNPPTCPIAKATAGAANIAAKSLGRKHRLIAVTTSEEANKMDAALADPIEPVNEDIVQIGKPVGVIEAELGMPLQKYGRTTKYTTGEVMLIDATVSVQYGAGKIAQFDEQIVAGAMSAGGDSGSAVLDTNNNLVGLLFAGSDSTTILNPMTIVFDVLGLSL
jgi:hypothetical protein